MKKNSFFYIIFTFLYVFLINCYLFAIKDDICFANWDNNFSVYDGQVTHIFTHCLIAFPSIAFSQSNLMKNDYDRDCITCDEFKNVLRALHKNNYILIRPSDYYEVKNGVVAKKKLIIPSNKKPLIFSFDDVNYDHKKLGYGMIDKLCLNSTGKIITSTNTNGSIKYSSDNEFVPILNAFVEENPDFSFNGAKGMLCLTGYDGILGYRTQAKNTVNRQSEIDKCLPVVKKLKDDGWTFACHSFGHYHMKKISDEKFNEELCRWNDEVVPLIGKTDIYVYPYGEWQILNDDKTEISQKHKLLFEDGFRLFCGVGVRQFAARFPKSCEFEKQILFMDRCPIDGFTLKNKGKDLSYLFLHENILDQNYR